MRMSSMSAPARLVPPLLLLLLLSLAAQHTVTALYTSSDDVVELTPANFDRLVLDDSAVWVVEFYAPWCGHCVALAPEYKKAATALKGVVKLGAVDADAHGSLASRYGVSGFPTLKIFAANKQKPTDFQGQRTASGIAVSALAAAQAAVRAKLGGAGGGGSKSSSGKAGAGDVVELTDANFDATVIDSDDIWLVEFYAPWCGHCKNLAPHWAEAATRLKGKVKLGALDATVHTIKAGEYGIRGFPTIKLFDGAKKRGSASDYDGGRTADDIVRWAEDRVAVNLPPPEVKQITSEADVSAACEQHGLCVMAFLPQLLDCQSQCRRDQLQLLQRLGERYKQQSWGWLWSEGGVQTDIEHALDIGGFGYPALVVVNKKKGFLSTLRGAFSQDGIGEFLRELSFGRGQTSTIRGGQLPQVRTVDPWDGQDAALPPEDDIDLSDVELDDAPVGNRDEL